ncbi:Uncharacterised protein [Bordetella ansorpii]|uniref:Lipoprotein n=1 Tax=Bordetella ansorpii TaxID=288768 RepID=A0A157S578_9BORD|nr:hypothetical protein [Bordetella ansorpii]SAI65578.1 Uncharacterised protein [Bordetella ansorpii]
MSVSDLRASMLLVAGLALPSAVLAQAPAVPSDSRAAPASCVDVEVNGYRAPSYDCLSQQMAPRARAPHENPALASEGVARMPSNQLGLFNRAATSNRMGSNFGNSAFPQRPAPIYTNPVAR